MGKRLDFAKVQNDFNSANTLNKLNAEFKRIKDNYELSDKQDTAIWNMYSTRRANMIASLTKQGAKGYFSPEYLQVYGDREVIA